MQPGNGCYTGIVKRIEKKDSHGVRRVHLDTENGAVILEHTYNMWLMEGDQVFGVASPVSTRNSAVVAKLTQRPAVFLPVDAAALGNAIHKALHHLEWREVTNLLRELDLANNPGSIPVIYSSLDHCSCASLRKDVVGLMEGLFPGFEFAQIRTILKWWKKNRIDRYLGILGIDYKMWDLTDMPHDQILKGAKVNPYRLYFIPITVADEIINVYQIKHSLGFKTDKAQGKSWDEERNYGNIGRKIAVFFYQNKHACITEDLAHRTISNYAQYAPYLEFITSENFIYIENRLKVQKYAHKLISEQLARPVSGYKFTPSSPSSVNGGRGEKKFSEDQVRAINLALQQPVSCITGGAGSGKTTIIKQVVSEVVKYGKKCILTSLTGRAVARMRTLGMHLIGTKKGKKKKAEEEEKKEGEETTDPLKVGKKKSKNPESPLKGTSDRRVESEDPVIVSTIHLLLARKQPLHGVEYIIIDENSMVTTPLFVELMRYVLKANNKCCPNLVFVGDVNQLEPIGWGSFYHQMLRSPKVPRVVLETNHRSCKAILNNANSILNRTPYSSSIDLIDGKLQGFTIVNQDPLATYYSLIPRNLLGQGVVAGSITLESPTLIEKYQQIRIITGYRDEVEKLNLAVQKQRFSILGDKAISAMDWNKKVWYLGDLVVMKKNSYILGVMNGDEGMIVNVEANYVEVLFDRLVALNKEEPDEDREELKPIRYYLTPKKGEYPSPVDFGDENIEEGEETLPLTNLLDLGYCITVDASQGSEYENVIVHIPTHGANRYFMTRNRVYTAITRGKSLVIGTGDCAYFEQCKNIMSQSRTDLLSEWI